MTSTNTFASGVNAMSGDASVMIFTILVAAGVAACLGLAYRYWKQRSIAKSFEFKPRLLKIGIVTSLVDEAICPEIGAAFEGFLRETLEILASRMGCSADISLVPASKVEVALNDKIYDFVMVDGNAALTFSSRVELLPCYVSSLTALALVFWEKMPHHLVTLQDFAYYPDNMTGVIKNSLEEHYLNMFDTIPLRRAESFTRLVVDLKLGLIRAGLLRMEQAKALKNEYASIRFVPVSLQKQCFIQDEKIAVLRTEKALLRELERRIITLRREGAMKKIHAKWFANLRPNLPPRKEAESLKDQSQQQQAS